MAFEFPVEPAESDLFAQDGKTYIFTNGAWRIHVFTGPDSNGTFAWENLRNVPGLVKSINGAVPDADGNIVVEAGGSATSQESITKTVGAAGDFETIAEASDSGVAKVFE